MNSSEGTSAERTRARAERYINACNEYALPFEREKLIDGWVSKERKAAGLIADFKERAGNPAGARLLEIGFGGGTQLAAFAGVGALVSGLEVNSVLLDIAKEVFSERGIPSDRLLLYDGVRIPFPDASFDYVFTTSVLEHVSHPRKLLLEIARVLKPGGKFYLSFPNRWAPRETHSGVWFISYLPLPLAEFIFRRFLGRNTVKELNLHFLSYFKLRRLMRGTGFTVLFETGSKTGIRRMLKRFLAALGIHQSALLKTVMVVLQKNAERADGEATLRS